MRALKAYTVFLSEHAPVRAYGVVGITSPIEETIAWPLPVYAQAALLPFEEQIIYDSLLSSYPIYFGPGIQRSLALDYRRAKEREGIITSLLPSGPHGPHEQRRQTTRRNSQLLAAFRQHLLKAGLSLKTVEQHAGALQTFAEATLEDHIPSLGLLEITPAMLQAYLHTVDTHTTHTASTSFKRFVRFLEETERMSYEQAEALRQVLRQR